MKRKKKIDADIENYTWISDLLRLYILGMILLLFLTMGITVIQSLTREYAAGNYCHEKGYAYFHTAGNCGLFGSCDVSVTRNYCERYVGGNIDRLYFDERELPHASGLNPIDYYSVFISQVEKNKEIR